MMRPVSFENHRTNSPQVQFVGEIETGLVHWAGVDGCDVEVYEVFLDVRTALVRGYQLCPHCAAGTSWYATPRSGFVPLPARA